MLVSRISQLYSRWLLPIAGVAAASGCGVCAESEPDKATPTYDLSAQSEHVSIGRLCQLAGVDMSAEFGGGLASGLVPIPATASSTATPTGDSNSKNDLFRACKRLQTSLVRARRSADRNDVIDRLEMGAVIDSVALRSLVNQTDTSNHIIGFVKHASIQLPAMEELPASVCTMKRLDAFRSGRLPRSADIFSSAVLSALAPTEADILRSPSAWCPRTAESVEHCLCGPLQSSWPAGVVIVRGALDRNLVASVRDHLETALARVDRSGGRPVPAGGSGFGVSGGRAPPPIAQPTTGRSHWPLHVWPEGSAVFRSGGIENAWLPTVATLAGVSGHTGLQLTELQLVNSMPGSVAQPWHADNAAGGITVVVPLIDQEEAMGPTQVALQTSGLHAARGWDAMTSTSKSVAQEGWATALARAAAAQIRSEASASIVAAPVLKAGDVMIYDARTLHRGLPNLSDRERPILVFRYDHAASVAPGQSRAQSIAIAALGTTIERFQPHSSSSLS